MGNLHLSSALCLCRFVDHLEIKAYFVSELHVHTYQNFEE